MMTISPFSRVFGRAAIGDGCWESGAGLGSHGYPQGYINGKVTTAHRLAFALWHGQSPQGQVNHRCDNKLCIRPSHLYDGTHQDNMDDVSRGKYHPRRRLTTEQAKEIKASSLPQRTLATRYGVSQRTIWNIRKGRAYRHG